MFAIEGKPGNIERTLDSGRFENFDAAACRKASGKARKAPSKSDGGAVGKVAARRTGHDYRAAQRRNGRSWPVAAGGPAAARGAGGSGTRPPGAGRLANAALGAVAAAVRERRGEKKLLLPRLKTGNHYLTIGKTVGPRRESASSPRRRKSAEGGGLNETPENERRFEVWPGRATDRRLLPFCRASARLAMEIAPQSEE